MTVAPRYSLAASRETKIPRSIQRRSVRTNGQGPLVMAYASLKDVVGDEVHGRGFHIWFIA